ncbi:MAG: ispG [Parachlamydiales bacterium]|nr:ispG [Parachlamydiales bacterium]
MNYCDSIYQTVRRKTREVMVGSVGVGGQNPIRIQSMTTTNTRDVSKTIDQIARLSDAGCEIIRVTVQGKLEAQSCEKIKCGLIQRGLTIPLVADIHFYPPAAMLVADFVDKIRINPGNFVDQRAQFKIIEYDDASYARELIKIEEAFSPLVEKCKRLKRSLRIGANHGSLSDRIMNRYGNTPRGMVESALEFTKVCRQMDFHDLIFSMKASNPIVMMEAYRLLACEMKRLDWDYPFHLGVTEAGAGEDGRIKSAMGMGALLLDGIGDTIRVSLTEDPVSEIDPCRRLVTLFEENLGRGIEPFAEKHRLTPRTARPFLHRDGAVVVKASSSEIASLTVQPDALWIDEAVQENGVRTFDSSSVCVHSKGLWPSSCPDPEFILFHPKISPVHETRRFVDDLKERGIDTPVILSLSYGESAEEVIIRASAEAGAVLADRLVEGICIEFNAPIDVKTKLSFNILQSARMRMSKTEFISCPGCGRTLFDLQTVAQRIREKTGHLPGVKIAIMGCIVNGPGEMADADFGFVGSKSGKIDLYVQKTCVKRDIDMADGPDELIQLIISHGRWVEPNCATFRLIAQ